METRKNSDFSIFILRIASGGMMLLAHGWGKLVAFKQIAAQFPDPLGVGSTASLGLVVFAEVICAALVAVGLFTRMAAVPLIITMGVAAFHIHAADPWQKKELSILYLACYIVVFFAGSGKYSLQNFLKISSSSRITFINWLSK